MGRVAVPILALLLVGCGGSTSTVVRGEIRDEGAAYRPDEADLAMVVFNETSPQGAFPQTYPTRLKANGSFEVAGPDGKGIPFGKYKVSFSSMPMNPNPGTPPGDKFGGAFAPDRTPWEANVTSRSTSFTFDLAPSR